MTALYTDRLIKPIEDWTDAEQRIVDDMNNEFVEEFSEPLAKLLAKNRLNKQYGRPIVDSYDYIDLMVAVWGYHRDLNELRQRRRESINDQRQRHAAEQAAQQQPPHQEPPTHVEPHAPVAQPAAPATNGVGIAIPFGQSID